MTALPPEPLVMGRCGQPYGVKGWLRVSAYTDPDTNLLQYRPWFLKVAGAWQQVQVTAGRPQAGALVVKLAGVDDRDAAAALAGTDIGVAAAQLPAPAADEYYWKDLIGLQVHNLQGRLLGQVTGLLDNGAHDVLVIRPADPADPAPEDLLIPFVAAYVGRVDLAAGQLEVDWPW